MNVKELNAVLGLAQKYINNIDLGCVYKVAVLTSKGVYTYEVRNNQARLKKNNLKTFVRDLAYECIENMNDGFYWDVKNSFEDFLKEDEAILLVYGSDCGDLDHFYRGTAEQLIKLVHDDFNEGE